MSALTRRKLLMIIGTQVQNFLGRRDLPSYILTTKKLENSAGGLMRYTGTLHENEAGGVLRNRADAG